MPAQEPLCGVPLSLILLMRQQQLGPTPCSSPRIFPARWWPRSTQATCCTCPPCGTTLWSSALVRRAAIGWWPSTTGARQAAHGCVDPIGCRPVGSSEVCHLWLCAGFVCAHIISSHNSLSHFDRRQVRYALWTCLCIFPGKAVCARLFGLHWLPKAGNCPELAFSPRLRAVTSKVAPCPSHQLYPPPTAAIPCLHQLAESLAAKAGLVPQPTAGISSGNQGGIHSSDRSQA